MKNLKVRAKLIVSFVVVCALMLCVGAAGFVGLTMMDGDANRLYQDQMLPLGDITAIESDQVMLRVHMRDYIVALASGDEQRVDNTRGLVVDLSDGMIARLDSYAASDNGSQAASLVAEAKAMLTGEYLPLHKQAYDNAKAGDMAACIATVELASTPQSQILSILERCVDARKASGQGLAASINSSAEALKALTLGILGVALIASVFLALYVSGLIAKPLGSLTGFMQRAGASGDLTFGRGDSEAFAGYSRRRDELGDLTSAAVSFVGHVTDTSRAMESVAAGDLTAETQLLSDKDTMGLSLGRMIENLNGMFHEISMSSEQVSTGSSHVSDGAQSLAAGATEQASSIEVLSNSISEITETTKANALTAKSAAKLSDEVRGQAETGKRQMDDMIKAVKEINEASQSISKVIKTIDDIAFQTNILALNAAVEAARAGQQGKGFAVVAEEVRSLAARSANAAKDTESLIANSMEKAELGVRIASDTAESLLGIVDGVNRSSALVMEISTSSDAQSRGIEEVNTGIDQVAQVIQHNSAIAQESAAASQEMSAQADVLLQLVSRFKLSRVPNAGGYGGAANKHAAGFAKGSSARIGA